MDISILVEKIITTTGPGAVAAVALLGWFLAEKKNAVLLKQMFGRDEKHVATLSQINAVLEVIKDRLGGRR